MTFDEDTPCELLVTGEWKDIVKLLRLSEKLEVIHELKISPKPWMSISFDAQEKAGR